LLNPLIIARDIHFASSMVVAGFVFFDLLVAAPVFRSNSRTDRARHAFRRTAEKVLWISLALSVASALGWLGLLSMRIAEKPLDEVIVDGTVWTVLTQTQFGLAWEVRLILAAALAMSLLWQGKTDKSWRELILKPLACLLAAGFLASLAFAGHGGEGLRGERMIHLAADALHLIAAGLWVGGLIPFVQLLNSLLALREEGWLSAASVLGNRFSSLGVVAVTVLLISGTINASFLLVGVNSLIDTNYGRLLLLKLVLVAAMLGLAAVNRQYLLPKLSEPAGNYRIFRRLVSQTLAEIALGLGIVLIVGTLGVMPPANEMTPHFH